MSVDKTSWVSAFLFCCKKILSSILRVIRWSFPTLHPCGKSVGNWTSKNWSCIVKMLFHFSILNVDRFYTDLIRSTYKIGTTIRPEDLDWSSNSRDTTQCIDKARTTHLFYQFNVYSTSGQCPNPSDPFQGLPLRTET
jgi:hypothetical protein